ncbi:hypothetical protein [Endozoicomonas sp. Mp262]|uniref:hypothetical protein n=1 Tax=Endozoicomonas sp. Mp262 TaxID=2919499 RepID=UPI0021D835D1
MMIIPDWAINLLPVLVIPATVGLFNLRTRVAVLEAKAEDDEGFKQLMDRMDKRLVKLETIIIEMRRKP